MDAATLYPPLLGASVALSVAIAVLVVADRGLAPAARWTTVALLAAGAAYSGFVGPDADDLPAPVRALLLAASVSGAVFFWALVRLLFEAGLPPARVLRQAAAVLLAGVVVPVGLAQAGPALRPAALGFVMLVAGALVLHVLAILVWGRRDDLDDNRRRLRMWVAGGAAVFVLAVLAARSAGLLEGRPAVAAAGLAGAQVALKLAWLLLTVGSPSAMDRLYRASHAAPPSPHATFAPLAAAVSPPGAPLPSVAEAQAARHARAILAAMEEQRLYREPGLGIGALARRLALPEHRVRAVVNGQLGFRNYSAFLNHFRLRAVAQRLRDPAQAHLPILSIALDEGYASLAPFNRAFRDAFGCSPSEFRRGAGAPD